MAEQIGHNVVDFPQSTSGSPLVDVAANQTTASSAHGGASAFEQPSVDKGASTHAVGLATTSSSANDTPILTPSSDTSKPSAGDGAHGAVGAQSVDTSEKNVAAPAGPINGMHDDASQGDGHADERSNADMSIDASANSDTDNSRADAAEKKDGHNHLRTNSVKKPATFSKVSVTRNFLAKTATIPSAAAKLGEKPSAAAAPLVARPRLVAKTGASFQSSQARTGADGAGGPDASKVWNKNQPTRPPPPKQFTDEELKQQYGIHLASRLQADDNGKENKWADIDDDEDDWAPEAVTWVDGTKSSLNPAEPAPSVSKDHNDVQEKTHNEQKPIVLVKDTQEEKPPSPALPAAKAPEAAKPTLTSMKRPEQSMKILKPGAAAMLAKQAGTASSSSTEKPSLKAKSPAPAPIKSPWAPVPKVESVSPINPPVFHAPPPPRAPSFATQDARAYESVTPHPPAREIAADTFDRAWKEGERGTRELYNSASGRYEPAPEVRRNGQRPDSAIRKPNVLQRPIPGGAGSDALSVRSGSQAEGSYDRRRGSSVSQGSMLSARRMSLAKPSDFVDTANDRSIPAAPSEAAQAKFSQQTAWEQQMPAQAALPDMSQEQITPVEDQLKMQERVMREKRELAIKRRKEEEEREEIAKQERLRAKLAALEGAGKSKKEREAEAAAAAAAAAAATSTKPSASTPEKDAQPAPSAVGPGHQSDHPPRAETSQGLQPKASAAAPGQQIPSNRPEQHLPSHSPMSNQTKASPTTVRQQLAGESASPSTEALGKNAAGNRAPFQQSGAGYKAQPSSYSSPGDRKPQATFGRSPNLNSESSFSPWPTAPSSSNVWGTSGIGNGTFEGSGNFAPLAIGQNASLPLPPGIGRQSGTDRISPSSFSQEERAANLQPQQQARSSADPRNFEPRPDHFSNQSRLNGVSAAPGAGRPAHPPGPIGPPSRTQIQTDQPNRGPSNVPGWQSFGGEHSNHIRPTGDNAAELQLHEPNNGKPLEHTFRETFKKTTPAARLGAPRKYDRTEYTVHDNQAASISPNQPAAQVQPNGLYSAAPGSSNPWKAVGDSAVRMTDSPANVSHRAPPQAPIGPPTSIARSNFLPPHLRPQPRYPTAPIEATLEPHDSAPPPPETETHPVNSGDAHHPQVRLPPPQAKVRLPPAVGSAQPSLPSLHVRGSAPIAPAQRQGAGYVSAGSQRPLVQQNEWQSRFNGLFSRTSVPAEAPPSPPKTPPKALGPVLAVASSSRAAMIENSVRGATVSLPNRGRSIRGQGSGFSDKGGISSKLTSSHLFDEERTFGSRPKVSIPRNTRYNLSPYRANARKPSSQLELVLVVDSTSKDTIPSYFFHKNPLGYHLRIPGTGLNNKLVKSSVPDGIHHSRGIRRQQDRRPSGKHDKSREAKDSASHSPASEVTKGISKRSPKPSQSTEQPPRAPAGDATPEKKRFSGKPSRTSRRPSAMPAVTAST